MEYTLEIREDVVNRVIKGDSIEDVSKDTGISVPIIYQWFREKNKENLDPALKDLSKKIRDLIAEKRFFEAKRLCITNKTDPVVQSQLITILIQEGNLEEAKRICQKFKNHLPIQSQLIKILIREGKLKEAREIAEKFRDHSEIQSQLVTILVKEGNLNEAKDICKKFPDYLAIQSQLVTILIKRGELEEAKKICESFRDVAEMQSQLIKILIKKGKLQEAEEICRSFPDNEVIQSQLVTILVETGKLEEAQKICEKFPDNKIIRVQMSGISSRIMETKLIGKEFAEELSRIRLKAQGELIIGTGIDILYKENMDKLDLIGQKNMRDLRAKMQLIMYLMKYGMYDVAEQRLPKETEIYKEIYRLVLFVRDNVAYDESMLLKSQMVQSIRWRIIKAGGNKEYVNMVIKKAMKIGEEGREI